MEQQIAFYEAKLDYEIDSWDLHVALKDRRDIIVIDTRSSQAYARSHIPGAINIPHRTITQETMSSLRRDCLYVTYCDGIGCNASTKSAFKLAKLGFKVRELIGGLDWWLRDGYAVESMDNGQDKPADCGCEG